MTSSRIDVMKEGATMKTRIFKVWKGEVGKRLAGAYLSIKASPFCTQVVLWGPRMGVRDHDWRRIHHHGDYIGSSRGRSPALVSYVPRVGPKGRKYLTRLEKSWVKMLGTVKKIRNPGAYFTASMKRALKRIPAWALKEIRRTRWKTQCDRFWVAVWLYNTGRPGIKALRDKSPWVPLVARQLWKGCNEQHLAMVSRMNRKAIVELLLGQELKPWALRACVSTLFDGVRAERHPTDYVMALLPSIAQRYDMVTEWRHMSDEQRQAVLLNHVREWQVDASALKKFLFEVLGGKRSATEEQMAEVISLCEDCYRMTCRIRFNMNPELIPEGAWAPQSWSLKKLREYHDVLTDIVNGLEAYRASSEIGPLPRPLAGEWCEEGVEIRTLIEEKDLAAEGREMHHCVGAYRHAVFSGAASIFRVEVEGERATIEVRARPELHLAQVKAKYNRKPSERLLGVVGQWVVRNGLTWQEGVY